MLYPSKEGHHSNTHTHRGMIGRKTARRHKAIEDSLMFKIRQSENNIRPDLIYKELDDDIDDKT